MTEHLIRGYEADSLDVQPGERAVVARINTAMVDRYHTVISPDGIDLSAYRACPTVLWEHGKDPTRGAVPVGRCQWIKLDRRAGALVSKTIFASDPYSDAIFRLYQEGCLRAFSVNVLPVEGEFGPPTRSELAARPELGKASTIYRRTELTEYSAVSVPGNSESLAIAVSRGLWVPDEVRDGLARVEPVDAANAADHAAKDKVADAMRSGDEDDDEFPRMCRRGDTYCVRDDDGEVMASYGTRDEAAKHCAALDASRCDKGRRFEHILAEHLGEIRSRQEDILKHIRDYSALLQGRV